MLQASISATFPFARGKYRRNPRLILINGLAEQEESWYETRDAWQRLFEVHMPALIVFDGQLIQRRMASGEPINVDYFVGQLTRYLDEYVQDPPYLLVGSSLGGQIVVEYAARNPEKVDKIALLCPSGVGGKERLPVGESVRHGDFQGLVASTYHDRTLVDPGVVDHYRVKFRIAPWRRGFFETVRGTKNHSVNESLRKIERPALVICGEQDTIVEPQRVKDAVADLPNFRYESIPNCGHAPQLECAERVYEMVSDFFLSRPEELA